ncbi:MAG TPA: c-type cytochrome [Acidobacteriaceae bacterium]|jgi:cytochrome c oxidase cbb3-type subunit 3
MKKYQAIAIALILGTIFCQSRHAAIYAVAAQNSPVNKASESSAAQTGTTQSSGHAEESHPSYSRPDSASVDPSEQAKLGGALFQQNCAFCHGRDAAGGETGPDLTRSKLVAQDVAGDKIAEVLRLGRPEKGMPPFTFSATEVAELVAFIHEQRSQAKLHNGDRRGVDVADLQTGNIAAGKQYFNGAGGCSSCHSPTGDLAGIASRYEGLELEERMLYPDDAKSTVTVTLPSGKTLKGTLAYQDEFTVGLRDADGTYHSWPVSSVRYSVSSPVEAHVAQFPKYTDADIHNLMAYLQTLR